MKKFPMTRMNKILRAAVRKLDRMPVERRIELLVASGALPAEKAEEARKKLTK